MLTSNKSINSGARRFGHLPYLASLVCITLALVSFCLSWRVEGQGAVALPEGRDGASYSGYQFDFDGGIKPITWSAVDSTKLPPGMHLSNAGVLSGIPTPTDGKARPAIYVFDIKATDSVGNFTTQQFSVTILAAKPLTIVVPTPTPTPVPFVLTSSSNDEETISVDQESQNIDGADSTNVCIPGSTTEEVMNNAQKVINSALGPTENAKFNVGDYCVIDLVRWKNAAASKSDKVNEAVTLFERVEGGAWKPHFDPQDKDKNLCKRSYSTRIFGSKRVTILPIHFNTPATWDLKYTVSVTQTTPTPLADALALAANLTASTAPAALVVAPAKTLWGAKQMLIKYPASEIVVKLNAVTANGDGQPAEQNKESSLKFINEGRYHWDVSVGLPVKTLRELTFVSDATNGNKISATAKERQDVYGFFNFFPKAVDLKENKFLTWPHFLFGVPLAGKPLHRPIVGIGTGMYKGPVKFNIFAGVVFIRERVPTTLNVGQSASQTQLDNDFHTRWVRKFTFGINFPVSQITQAIKGKK